MNYADNSLGTTHQLNITAKMIVNFITNMEICFVWLRIETVVFV